MYKMLRTDTADAGIRKIVLHIAENLDPDTALKKLNELERAINRLSKDPYMGMDPKYMVLRRQRFKVLITEKNLIFYKVIEEAENVVIYAVTDQRQAYIRILQGL